MCLLGRRKEDRVTTKIDQAGLDAALRRHVETGRYFDEATGQDYGRSGG
jgi:hypothetical protein